MATLLLTGASGFVGRHLSGLLLESRPGIRLVSVGRTDPGLSAAHRNVEHIRCDLTDESQVNAAIASVLPDEVFHLAGVAQASGTLGMPEYFAGNFLPTVHLLGALKQLRRKVALFFSSSVHVYGNSEEEVDETSPARPATAYGYSKYLAEEALSHFTRDHDWLRVVVGRLYTCIGPGQPPGFVVSDLCRRLARLPDSPESVLETGPLSAVRRFMDVRDAVRIFPALLDTPGASRFEAFNLASPHEMAIADMLQVLLRVAHKWPRVQSSGAIAANTFAGLRVSTEKLEGRLAQLSFRPIEETLRDTYLSVKG